MMDEQRRCHFLSPTTTRYELADAIHCQTPLTANCGVEWVPAFSGEEAMNFPYCRGCVDDLRVREQNLRQALQELAASLQVWL